MLNSWLRRGSRYGSRQFEYRNGRHAATYTALEESINFKIKGIEVKPGASLSLQMHHHCSEHWTVVSGMARVTNGQQELFVNTNESTYIPAGHKHRMENPGPLDLMIIKVQSDEYLGEDDNCAF